MNMINGAVSPYYFKTIMGWDFDNVWIASVAQGIFEGLLYGVVFSIIYTSAFGIITRGEGSYSFALRQLLKLMVLVLVFWMIGGFLAMVLAVMSPDFYRSQFLFVPKENIAMLKFAWVGGSIWGSLFGCVVTLMLGIIVIKNRWTCIYPKKP